MSSDIIEVVRQRKNFYRDNYHRSLQALLFCLMIIIGLITAIIFVKITQPERTYFATSSDGGLTQISPARWGSRIIQPPQTVPNTQT